MLETFSKPGSGWPRDGYRKGAFVLPAKGSAAVLAPQPVEPATRGTLSEVTVQVPERGAAGLLCRASANGGTGYGLLLSGRGKVQLLRLEDGKAKVLKQHFLTPNERSDPGKPSLLRLGCGTGTPGEPVTLIYAINATPFGYVTDQREHRSRQHGAGRAARARRRRAVRQLRALPGGLTRDRDDRHAAGVADRLRRSRPGARRPCGT